MRKFANNLSAQGGLFAVQRRQSTETASAAAGFFRSLIVGTDLVPYPAQSCGEEEGGNVTEMLQKAEEATSQSGEALHQALVESGVYGSTVPDEIGGFGLGHSSLAFSCETLAIDKPRVPPLMIHHTGPVMEAMRTAASSEQHGRWYPAMSDGSMVCAWAVEEKQCGSDISAITTTGKLSEDGTCFILNGRKSPVLATYATHFLTAAKTETQSTSTVGGTPVVEQRVTLIVVDRKDPGVKVVPLGPNGTGASEIILEDASVPTANVLGTAGQGFGLYQIAKNQCNYTVAASCLGACKKLLDMIQDTLAESCKENRANSIKTRTWVNLAARAYGLESALYALTANLDRKVDDCLIESALVTAFAADTATYFVTHATPLLNPTQKESSEFKEVFDLLTELPLTTIELSTLKHMGACCGVEDFGVWFRATSTLSMMQLRSLRSLGQIAKFPGKGKGLQDEVARFEKAVSTFGESVESFFVKTGLRVRHDTLKLERLADACGLLYACATSIARIDKTVAQKQPTAATETQLASVFINDALVEVESLCQQIRKSAQSCDDAYGRLISELCEEYLAGCVAAPTTTEAEGEPAKVDETPQQEKTSSSPGTARREDENPQNERQD